MYRELVELFTRGGLDWAQVRTFNLDEFLGVSADDAGSFRAYMERHLFQHVNLSPANIQFLDGAVEDAEAECARYEARLAEAGGLDLVLLGLGSNGHLAFNEPADGLRARCHRTRLSRQTREANLMLFGDDPSRVPMEALTLGMASILQARQALLLAFGEAKADAVRGMVEGPVSPAVPPPSSSSTRTSKCGWTRRRPARCRAPRLPQLRPFSAGAAGFFGSFTAEAGAFMRAGATGFGFATGFTAGGVFRGGGGRVSSHAASTLGT